MADASLDDFFAKKDKSKKKTKSKVTPGDILSKQEKELSGSKKEKKKKDKEKQQTSEGTSGSTETPVRIEEKDDEEWVDFEQETEKDYSGLRIQNLQISKEEPPPEEENRESENEDENDENGDRRESKESGPWNKSQGQQPQGATSAAPAPAPVPQAAPAPTEEPKEATPAKSPGKYVPPGARAASQSDQSIRPTPLRKKRAAPNLQSEEDFPTLGGPGGSPGDPSDGRGTIFEKVQSGGRNTEDPNKLQSLSLGNKFSALQD